jgi:hypothetical protein
MPSAIAFGRMRPSLPHAALSRIRFPAARRLRGQRSGPNGGSRSVAASRSPRLAQGPSIARGRRARSWDRPAGRRRPEAPGRGPSGARIAADENPGRASPVGAAAPTCPSAFRWHRRGRPCSVALTAATTRVRREGLDARKDGPAWFVVRCEQCYLLVADTGAMARDAAQQRRAAVPRAVGERISHVP